MALPTFYAVGTASVANGATTITFSGALLGSEDAPNFQPGDLFLDPAQPLVPPQRIESIDYDAETAELWVNWPGTSMTSDPYEVRYIGDPVRSTAQTRRLLEQMRVIEANGRGLFYTFTDATTDADHGPGVIALNHATIGSATAAYLDNLDANGATVSTILDTWDDSTSTIRGQLWVRGIENPAAFHAFSVTGSVVDGTGYRKLTLTHVGGSGTFAADDELMVFFSPTGDAADIGFYDARLSGTVGSGSVDDRAALLDADGHDNVLLAPGTYRVDTDVTFLGHWTFRYGGKIKVPTGVTVTFSEQMSAPISQIFECVGTGKVVLPTGTVAPVEWWGAVGNASADNLAPLQKAIDAFPTGYGTLRFRPFSQYNVSNKLSIETSFMTLECASRLARHTGPATLVSTHSTEPALEVQGVSAGGGDGDGLLENFNSINVFYSRSAMGAAGSNTLRILNATFCNIENGGAALSQYGVALLNVNSLHITKWNATVGGDLAEHLYGIYVDGASQGSTGIIIEDLDFFSGASPSALSVNPYFDTGAGTSSEGDRIIRNFKCSGPLTTGITISGVGGFGSDVQLSNLTMDDVKGAGIRLISDGNSDAGQANISHFWINMTNASGVAIGIEIEGKANVNIATGSITNSGTGSSANIGVRAKGAKQGSLMGVNFPGTILAQAIDFISDGAVNSDLWTVGPMTIHNGSPIHLGDAGGCVFSGVNAPYSAVVVDAGSDFNRFNGGTRGAVTDNGASNVFA